MFALRHKDTGTLVSVDIYDYTVCKLFAGLSNDNIWVVRKREIAEYAATHDTPRYNADYETPVNPYLGKLEVVELIIK